jgi:hypothetical protein
LSVAKQVREIVLTPPCRNARGFLFFCALFGK